MTAPEPDTWTFPDAYDCVEPGWMQPLCKHDDDTGRHPWHQFVQSLQLAGRTWSVATDTKGMLIFDDRGAEAGESLKAHPRYAAWADRPHGGPEKLVEDFLLRGIGDDFTCDLADLLAFLGPFTMEPCDRCPGVTGQSNGCAECDFTGTVWPIKPDVRLVHPGRWFDPNLLAKYLTPLTPFVRRVRVGLHLNHVAHAQRVFVAEPADRGGTDAAPWFRVVVMPLAEVKGFRNGGGVKRLDVGTARYIPGVGALWHLRGGQEYPLRDWIQDQGHDPDDVTGVPF